MNKAINMFMKMGFYMKVNTDNDLLYKKETKYERVSAFFLKDRKLFYVSREHFVPKDMCFWEAQIDKGEESDWILHSSKYGHWECNFSYEIDMELLQAINQQCRELGWIK